MRRLLFVAFAVCVALPASASAFPPAVGACTDEAVAVAAMRGGSGSFGEIPSITLTRPACEFVVGCPQSTALPGCRIDVSVSVTGTGVVEGAADGDFGVLSCGPVMDACAITADTLMSPGAIAVVECSATGAAADVTVTCSVEQQV